MWDFAETGHAGQAGSCPSLAGPEAVRQLFLAVWPAWVFLGAVTLYHGQGKQQSEAEKSLGV